MTQAPRLKPLPVEQWDEKAMQALRLAFPSDLVERMRASGNAPNVLATMLHHPALAGPFTAYGNVLLQRPAIGHRNRELMLLRVAWRTGARYEWVHHVRLASRYGVTRDDVNAIAEDRMSSTWTDIEYDLVVATDEMLDSYRVCEATWRRLEKHFDAEQLVEIPFIVGTYTCLAMAFNSWDLREESDIDVAGLPLPRPR
jgi:4-carboxymuconolactone decarboxylase